MNHEFSTLFGIKMDISCSLSDNHLFKNLVEVNSFHVLERLFDNVYLVFVKN